METLCDFRCESCGYRTEVSGREDWGFSLATTTIFCEGCKELYDVAISEDSMTRKPARKVSIHRLKKDSHHWRLW